MNVRHSALVLGVGLVISALSLIGATRGGGEKETADLLIKLLKAGRSVISDYQDIINDPARADKGFTPAIMEEEALLRFKDKTGVDMARVPDKRRAKLLWTLLEAEKEVVKAWQPVINKKGIGFKGVLPAKFARKTGEKFYRKTGIKMKLTSLDYRYPANKPDAFEAGVLRLFSDPGYPSDQDYSKLTMIADKRVLRVMSPEYAKASCLKCHGTPKGARDITGGRKEGWKEGDLGGAISVIMPMR